MTERLHFDFSLSCIGAGNGNPLQCFCLENPRDGGAWWAAVYGVAQSWTWRKRLGSSRQQQAIFHSGYTIFLFHRQWRRILISLYMHPHLLFPFLLFYCRLSGYEGFPGSLAVKNLPAIQEMWVWSLGWEDLWEKEMATHFSILVWEIPWTEKPDGLQLMGSQKSWSQLSN